MKKYLLFINILLAQLALSSTATAQSQTVVNGQTTTPMPLYPCASTWTNDKPGIGLPATGTTDIPSFTAVNTGTTPVTATITINPSIYAYVQCKGGALDVINTATGTIVSGTPYFLTGCEPLTVSPNQQLVYFQTADNNIQIISAADGSFAGFIPMTNQFNEILVSANGQVLYMSSFSTNQVFVYDMFSGTTTPISIGTTGVGPPQSMILSPDQSKLYVTDAKSGAIHVINTTTKTVTGTIPLFTANDMSQGVAISPDGTKLYVTDQTGNMVKVVNTATNAVIATITEAGGPSYCLLSADGSRLYVSNSIGGSVSVINTATNTIITTIPMGSDPFGLSLLPDGSQLYVSNVNSNAVYVVNTATNTVVRTIPTTASHPAPWGNFIASPCGPTYTYTITVNPSPSITTTAVSGTIQACAGNASASPDIQTFSVSGTYLTTNITATAPSGFEVSLSPASGYGNSVTIPQSTGTVTSIPVYIRSAAAAPAGGLTGNVTLTSTGATTKTVGVAGTINPNLTPSVTIVSNNNPACAGSLVIFTATPVNGGASPIYQWKVNGANVGTNMPTYFNPAPNNGDLVTCLMTSNAPCAGGPVTSNTITMTVLPFLTPSMTLTSSAICAGSPATITSTTVAAGPGSQYNWIIDGVPDLTNSPTYTINAPHNGTQVSCIFVSDYACPTTNLVPSNTLTLTVNPVVTPSITIAASASTICTGTPVTFTATPTGGGTAPVYQWLLNGNPVGTNSPTYTSNALTSTDQVSCVLTSNAACATGPATSNTIITTVNPLVTPTLTIAASVPTICAGAPVTFTAAPTNGGTAPTYQWRLNGSPTGTNSPTFLSTTLTSTDQVSCILTSNAACATGPATSNTLLTTVNPLLTPTLTIAASVPAICAGAPVTFTATPTNQGTAPVYQWRLNGTNTGTNSPTYTSATLTSTDQVSCVLTSNAVCATGPATSNTITTIVNPLVTPNIIIAASVPTICAGAPVTFTAAPTNGGTAPTYQWRLNGSPTGTNSPTFLSTTLTSTDQVSCVLTSNTVCATGPATSNTILTTVNPLVTPTLIIAASVPAICAGAPVTFTATPTNQGTAPTYQWRLNGSPIGTNSLTYASTTLTGTDQVSCVLTSNAVCATGPATSNTITTPVTPLVIPTVAVTPATPEVCEGLPITFTAKASNTGSQPVYQWMINGVNKGSNSATYSSSVLNDGDQVACKVTGNLACSLPGASVPLRMTVNPLPTVSFATDPVYKGIGGVQLDPDITGLIATYEWTPTDGLSAANIANPIASLESAQTYQLKVTTYKGCIALGKVTVITRLPLDMPKAFTPNGDGHNDVFRIPVGATITLEQFSVFSRLGEEVFSTRNSAVGWDGTYHGQPALPGTYVYIVKGKDSQGKLIVLRGTVILIK